MRVSNESKNDITAASVGRADALPTWLQLVREHVTSLKFGTVQITVHDSRVVQVERAEKLRLDKPE